MKELVMISFVRLYQAIEAGGQTVKLDIYEGMAHVSQAVPGLPEATIALGKADDFLKKYLGE